MGETISYSSGKVPEPRTDVASLVEEARERAAYWGDSLQRRTNRAADEYSVDVPNLCSHLEEREREVERLRKYNGRLTSLYYPPQAQELIHELEEKQREVERLETDYWRVEKKRCEMHEENERLRAILEERGQENERLREACEACADVVGLISDASAERHAMKKLKEAGFGDY